MSNNIYCTYLTTYSGDKLPPLYIGSTSLEKIEEGYHGSVSSKKYKELWNKELKENPQLFETQILTTHSTRNEAFEEEIRLQELHDVVNSDLYINMAIACGKTIFVDYDDLEWRKKISEATRGKKKSEEHKKKLSESLKDRKLSEETKKKMSESQTDERRMYMSVTAQKRYLSEEYRKNHSEATKNGMTDEARKKMSEAQKKRYENPEERKKTSESTKDKPKPRNKTNA